MGRVGQLPREYRPRDYEREVLEFWRRERVYERLRESLRGRPKFYFLDGPPYPSSELIHVGTAWNKIIKDAVIRYRRARGFDVRDVPGYDCHGLPIEVAVEKRFGFKSKKDIESFGVDRFIEECKKLALRNAASMSRQFIDLGVSMDWERPYMTLTNEYIESAWWLVKRAYERGLLERGLRVVHWCPRCETVLADYEVSEYRVIEDPSIYVKLPVRGGEGEYLVVWTTTPWTLPANVAVMAHPDFEYARVRVGSEVLIMAKERVEPVMREAGIEDYEVVEVVRGEDLDGLEYVPPLLEEVDAQRRVEGAHRVVMSREYVHLLEGTGLVHTAPGHGEEDFEVGLRYGLPVLMLVDDRGAFTEEAGKYRGMYVRDANDAIVEDLERKGLLLHRGVVRHRYPVCWRCKTPLILRATEQWLIRVTKIKDDIIREARRVRWIPEWAGSHRFMNWLTGLRDWVLSRQRYWGTPLPIWVCESCGNVTVVGSLAELVERSWPKVSGVPDLHKPWIDRVTLRCDKCGALMRRVPDVVDVWLDSGVAFFASIGYPRDPEALERWMPVDFIVEGHDQFSGWFDKVLKSGVIAFGRAPYRNVLVHGFTLDERGREMHKSLGNFITPGEVVERYCRDALRLYELSNTTWEDLRFSWEGVRRAMADLNVMWNVYVFASMYMSLDKFDPTEWTLERVREWLRPEDRWVLSRLNRLVRDVTEFMEGFLVHEAVRAIRRFVVEDLSHWYVRLVRRRVWIEREDPAKLSAYATLYAVLRTLTVLAAPFVPFIAEKIYQHVFRGAELGMPDSVHMLRWPEPDEAWIDEELEREMEVAREVVEASLSARMSAGVKLRQPLPELVVLTSDEAAARAVERLRDVIASQANVKRVAVRPEADLTSYAELKLAVNEAALAELGLSAAAVREAVGAVGLAATYFQLSRLGRVELEVEGRRVALTAEQLAVERRPASGYALADFSGGAVALCVRLTEEELLEGLARDIVRRVQYMRKEMDLPVEEFIDVLVAGDEFVARAVERHADYIRGETRARELRAVSELPELEGAYVKSWRIGERTVTIAVLRERR